MLTKTEIKTNTIKKSLLEIEGKKIYLFQLVAEA